MSRKKFNPYLIERATIIDAASDGRGVAVHEDRKIFTEYAVPGDEVELRVFEKSKRLFSAELKQVLKPSERRTEAACKHFGVCGGCKWQMMKYDSQLYFKQKQVTDVFQRVGKVQIGEVLPILPSPQTLFYRNKLEFGFGTRAYIARGQFLENTENLNRPVLGFHGKGVFDKIIDIETCHLQKEIINDIRNEVRDFAASQEIPFYDLKSHEGYLRQLVFRTSEATGELMLTLIVGNAEHPEWIDLIFEHLAAKFPQISSFLYIINAKLNSSWSDLPFHTWKGTPYITENLGGYNFRISPTSFFQTNPNQAERLYGAAKDMLKEVLPEGEAKHKIVYDLYTGTGSIAIYVSDLAEKVVGIEYVESSIHDAGINCEINKLTHLHFYAGDMAKVLTDELLAKEGKPDVIITDPPRVGMAKGVVEQILKVLPAHIIYISCHPATQARDLDMLRNAYEVVKIQPVDMFPQTTHVENIALLKLRVDAKAEIAESSEGMSAEEE